MKASKVDVYTKITNDVIALMEEGQVAWRKPWKYAGISRHQNFKSKSPYRGINAFITYATAMTKGFDSPYWLTYKQATELGGVVKKGSKSTSVVFYTKVWFNKAKQVVKQPKGVSDAEMVAKGCKMFLSPKYYNVFNLDQIEGIEWSVDSKDYNHNEIIEKAEQIINEMPNKPTYTIIESEGAYYRPITDEINMPLLEQFDNADSYYSTFFHEMIHSTGHDSRLKREGIVELNGFGSETYSQEELIAELGSCFLCAETGILPQQIDNATAYIKHWIKQLKDDKKLIWKASQDAQKAVDYIIA